MKLAFIGLGVMGYPMAGHLQQAGHDVCVYNRTTATAERWVSEFGGSLAASPALAAKDCDIVFACVGNDDDVRQVAYSDSGIFAGMNSGGIFVDHTTASADLARELNDYARAQGQAFIDAPVSGGQAGAENGVLTVMCGGAEDDFERIKPIMAAYSRFSQRLGDAGSGQLAKMVNQICIAGVVQGLAEGLHFAQAAGLDGEKLIETISKGAAGSWQMENRHKSMLDDHYEHGFAVDWMRKDLAIALNEARNNGAQLPVAALVDQFYADVQRLGGGRWDTSSLLARLTPRNK